MFQKPILVILGPTSVGKTKLSIKIAKKIDGEIINADSMQIYKDLDIGTGKPTINEMNGVKHHLVGVIDHNQDFNLADYVRLARNKILDINLRHKLPIFVGGTGLYIDTVINNINLDIVPKDLKLRQKLQDEFNKNGSEWLFKQLSVVDSKSVLKINKNDVKRLIRALEINYLTGKTVDEVYMKSKQQVINDVFFIGLNYRDRKLLYEQINDRVDMMMTRGLLDEAKRLFNKGFSKTAIQAIGYKEFIDYFQGKDSIYNVINKIKMNTRRYAKRQLTWFRRNDKIHWLNVDEYDNFDEIEDVCLNWLEGWLMKER